MEHSLEFTWMCIIGFSFVMYIILDGFVIGIGIVCPFLNEHQRDLAFSAVLPVWDGNQTWLVCGGALLYGMFPIAFAYLMPKIYLPVILLLVLLIFRGVCFEFRLKTKKGKGFYDKLFAVSSLLIGLAHGYLAGQVIIGYETHHFETEGWGLKIMAAITLVLGYMTLGATRLMLKTEGDLFDKTRLISKRCSYLLLIFGLICILITLLRAEVNLSFLRIIILTGIGVCCLLFFVLLQLSINKGNDIFPYWSTVGLFVMIFLSLFIYIFPYLIPYDLKYWEASSSETTLKFSLIPAVIMFPILLLYTGYNYYVFRGKVKEKISY